MVELARHSPALLSESDGSAFHLALATRIDLRTVEGELTRGFDTVRRAKARSSSGCEAYRATVVMWSRTISAGPGVSFPAYGVHGRADYFALLSVSELRV